MIFLHQLLSQLFLIWWRCVGHVENAILGAHVLRRVAMTIQAPLHPQRSGLPRETHEVDPPMTGGTTDSFMYVDTVVEVNEVREIVDSRLLNRFPGAVTLPYRLKCRCYRSHLRMAIHADLGGRNIGKRRGLDGGMAITAVYSQAARMMFMAERHRLFARLILAGFIRRFGDPIAVTGKLRYCQEDADKR